ncbi:hypothetical protein MOP88_19955 [Sphingomonas sp. WKB10]|nr:hypothetical protein [Sphingomonas sp. WKB10]
MRSPMRLRRSNVSPPAARGRIDDGLSVAIDAVATRAAPTHGFLRYGWYAAALDAYGGRARTLVVEEEGQPALALPFVGIGPGFARGAAVPGSYWPFRSFPLAADAGRRCCGWRWRRWRAPSRCCGSGRSMTTMPR